MKGRGQLRGEGIYSPDCVFPGTIKDSSYLLKTHKIVYWEKVAQKCIRKQGKAS